MESATASAPGKLFLFGEHAVIHGTPSVVTAIDRRMTVTAAKRNDDQIILTAPDRGMFNERISLEPIKRTQESRFVSAAVGAFFGKTGQRSGLDISTKSEFSGLNSLGSSAAVTVATIKALDTLFGTKLSQRDIFDLGFKAHAQDVQGGRGSGFDIAAATYGGTLYYKKGGELIDPIRCDNMPLKYFTIPGIKFDTATMISAVGADKEKHKEVYEAVLSTVTVVIKQARSSIEAGDWHTVGRLMNINQSFLESIGVSTIQATRVIYAVRIAGAYGAKITGGGGDNVICLSPEHHEQNILMAAEKECGRHVPVKPGEPGCRAEQS